MSPPATRRTRIETSTAVEHDLIWITYFYEINENDIQTETVFGLPYRTRSDSYAAIDVDCSQMEVDGSNALAALASYFPEPSRTTAPTADELINNEEIWTSYPFKISQAGEDILIFVIGEKINARKVQHMWFPSTEQGYGLNNKL